MLVRSDRDLVGIHRRGDDGAGLRLGGGPGAVLSNWSPYVLVAAGAATMLLASHALAAGPLAASQPGSTIFDPLSACMLGVLLFGEHIRAGAVDLAGEALAVAVVIAGAVVLSRSCLALGASASVCPPRPPRGGQDSGGRQPGLSTDPGLAEGDAHSAPRPQARKKETSHDRQAAAPYGGAP